jgi:8-oxo-dGTP pyrophosphatase MutT (NUDIX family)
VKMAFDDATIPDPARPQRAVKPRDAATLILVRDGKVLMGQRSKGHVFMPDKWVFPGGKVDASDAQARAASELTPEAENYIRCGGKRRPRAFALAAVRETFEETGLVVGKACASLDAAAPNWSDYAACGAAPDLARFTFVCRAITPPSRARRFDAHFFLVDAREALMDDRPIGGGPELLHTEWFSLDDALKLDLPSITRFVLGEVKERLDGKKLAPPYLRWTRKGHQMDRL